jgi:hypothetical protein
MSMNATAELLQPSPAARGAMPARTRKPRRRAYRRSEFGRPSFLELDPPIEGQSLEARFWERYAIPGGMAAFWIVFVASNWEALWALVSGATL